MAFNETPTKGFVMKLKNVNDINKLSPEELVAYNRELTRKAVRNFLIFVGIKAASYYAIYRFAKHVNEDI